MYCQNIQNTTFYQNTCNDRLKILVSFYVTRQFSECFIAKVGSGLKSKTITIGNGLQCPELVDKSNWLGGHQWPDTFSVVQNGSDIVVTRTDSTDGWAMDLQFMCCPKRSTISFLT